MKVPISALCILLALQGASGDTTKTPGVARFALCQTDALETASEESVADVFAWVRGRLRGDEDAIVLPEMAFTSFSEFPDAWRYAPAVWRQAADFAVERDAWVFVNHPNREGDGADARLFNETRVFSPDGGVAAVYRKRVLANMDVAAGFSRGSETTVADLPFARIGLLICKDVFYPEKGGAGYVAADMLLVQFSHPGVDDRDAPEAAGFPSSAQSFKNLRNARRRWSHLKVPFAAANKDGPDGRYVLCGGTFAADSAGTAFAGRKSGAGVVFADFPLRADGRIAPPPPFEVSLDSAGGSVPASRILVGRGSRIGTLPVPSRKGHVFLGWYTSRDGGSKVSASTRPSRDLPLFARWRPTTYAVSFSANGGTLPKGARMAAQKMSYGKSAALRKNAFARKGRVFAGWSKTKNGPVAYRDAQSVRNLRADGAWLTLYAVWAKPAYRVAFLANGGAGSMPAQDFAYGRAKRLSANRFAKKGHRFAGWAKSAADARRGKVAYRDGNPVKNLVRNGGTVKLYAVWKRK